MHVLLDGELSHSWYPCYNQFDLSKSLVTFRDVKQLKNIDNLVQRREIQKVGLPNGKKSKIF